MGVMQAWTSPRGWRAVGTVHEDGSMTQAVIDDANGFKRGEGFYFKSREEFFDYVEKIIKRNY